MIAFAGGIQTAEFNYQRPKAEQFPEDVLNFWRYHFAKVLRSKYDTILVAEDLADLDKDEAMPEIVSRYYSTQGVGRCIVGFAQMKLKATYRNQRTFDQFPVRDRMTEGMKREQSAENSSKYNVRVFQEHSRRLEDARLSLDILTVHPVYHRRGHGRKLV